MIYAKYNNTDRRYIFLYSDNQKEIKALEAHLNKIPRYMFLPSYGGVPKPEVFLHKFLKDGKTVYWCHSGLWHEIFLWCSTHSVAMEGLHTDREFKYTSFDWSREAFTEWVTGLGLTPQPRDYQIEAAWKILKYRQSMSQLATRSGKTLIAYVVLRWLMQFAGAHNILMIVPNTSLVKQGVEDFKSYGEFFNTETVWAKSELCDSSNITIGTFQSLVNRLNKGSKSYNPKFFDKFDVVLCDECHKLKCKSIDTILSQPFMKNLKLRFGFSGTIPEDGTIENFACQSLMGPVIQDIGTKELIDAGFLAKVDIEQVKIRYPMTPDLQDEYIRCGEYICSNYAVSKSGGKVLLPKEERQFLIQHVKTLPHSLKVVKASASREDYIDYLTDLCKAKGSNLLLLEQMITFTREERFSTISEILASRKGNCIVFAHHREYIAKMASKISETSDREVFIITGSTAQKKRESIIKRMEESDNCVLFASYSCVGTGLTFKNVDFGIFAESFKSQIINKQSLGRGLLLAPGKDTFKLYDIIDCLPTRRLEAHGTSKRKLFAKEGFSVTTREVLNS